MFDNAFVVIVHSFGQVLQFERPQNLSAAVEKYKAYIKQYQKDEVHPNQTFSIGDYNDQYIEKHIRKWKGNPIAVNHLYRMVFESQYGDVKITLKHKSVA